MPMHGAVAAIHVMTADQRADHIKQMRAKSREKLDVEIKRAEAQNNWPLVRRKLLHLVSSHWFEVSCGCVILFNMVLVVIETDAGVDDADPPSWIGVVTHVLLALYSAELAAKLYVYRCHFFAEMWNVLDFVIVGVDIVFLIIALIVDEMPSVSILRVFRLVRLARAFKAARSLRELNSLLRACTCALKAIFWGMVMMVLTLTVWGILAVQLIHPINKEIAENKPQLYEGCERCPRAYSTVFDSALTFWKQLVAGDSWGTLCEPIIEEAPWTAILFMMVLVTVNLTMLNCILAVVVEAGAAAATADEHDRALQQEKMVVQAEGRLIDLCQNLDGDGSGSLSIQEFLKGFHQNNEFRECLELMNVTESDMTMIFNICDEDDSGEVDYREFLDQFRRIKHSGEQMLLHYVTDIRHRVNKIRPECLKQTTKNKEPFEAEEKRDQTKEGAWASEDEGLVAVASPTQDLLPPLPAEVLVSNDAPVDKPDKFQEKTDEEAGIGDILRKEKFERIWQTNEDLVAIMTDLAGQSKVQTQLLNVLVQKTVGNGSGGGEQSAGAVGQSSNTDDNADPDLVQLGEATPTGGIGVRGGTTCCVRKV